MDLHPKFRRVEGDRETASTTPIQMDRKQGPTLGEA